MNTPAGNLIVDHGHYTLRSISVSEMENNIYLLTSKDTGQQILIDAADQAERIQEFLEAARAEDLAAGEANEEEAKVHLDAILTTHSHWDHIRALSETASTYTAKTYAGALDAPAIKEQEGVETSQELHGGETLTFDSFTLHTMHLQGHTPGSIAFVLTADDPTHPTIIFTGDSLFPGGVGKTNSPADFTSLIDDVTEKIFGVYEDSTLILPGHGQATTLGVDRKNLDQWRARGW